jgi:hypothetical protein
MVSLTEVFNKGGKAGLRLWWEVEKCNYFCFSKFFLLEEIKISSWKKEGNLEKSPKKPSTGGTLGKETARGNERSGSREVGEKPREKCNG